MNVFNLQLRDISKMCGIKFIILLMLLVGISLNPIYASVNSVDSIQTSRYSTQINGLKDYQVDLLQQSVSIKFNDSVQTINQALEALLKFSGFHLLPFNEQNKLAQVMLSNPLPNALREIKQATLKQALTGLTGGVFNIVVDPIYRTIAFKPKSSVAALYDSHSQSTQTKDAKIEARETAATISHVN